MTQFASIHIRLSDDSVYVAFRGMDNTIVGWREDFSISFQIVPAQRRAADYMNRTVLENETVYRIGGHSKGGNLAIYGGMMCRPEVQDRIVEIYSNDESGFVPH